MINADIGAQSPVAALKIKESARYGHSTVVSIGYRHDEWFGTHINARINATPQQSVAFMEALAPVIRLDNQVTEEQVADLASLIQADKKICRGFNYTTSRN